MAQPLVSDPDSRRWGPEPSRLDIYTANTRTRYIANTRNYFANVDITSDTSSFRGSVHMVNRVEHGAIPEKQKLGYFAVASLIINNMVGVGKYIYTYIRIYIYGLWGNYMYSANNIYWGNRDFYISGDCPTMHRE